MALQTRMNDVVSPCVKTLLPQQAACLTAKLMHYLIKMPLFVLIRDNIIEQTNKSFLNHEQAIPLIRSLFK